MQTVKLNLKENGYPIVIGHGILPDAGRILGQLGLGEDAVVITAPPIRKRHGNTLVKSLSKSGFRVEVMEVPDGEKSKSAAVAFKLMEKVARFDVRKKIFIAAFGGGVIGDLAGYVAAAYKRGVPYVQVPTTFLAQIDSSIGGKVAIDLPVGKNLVGAFHQPRMVLSDTAVLETLDLRQVRNGLAEAIKYGVICDKQLFRFLESNVVRLLARDPETMDHVVTACSRIKAGVVARDEKETKGIRTILNFGHTVGHAVEAAGKFRLYHHGESVALGMRVALRMSCRMGLLDKSAADRVEQVLDAAGLPQKIRKMDTAQILSHMAHDKKFSGGTNRFVLATSIGSVKVVEGVPAGVILSAIKSCLA